MERSKVWLKFVGFSEVLGSVGGIAGCVRLFLCCYISMEVQEIRGGCRGETVMVGALRVNAHLLSLNWH